MFSPDGKSVLICSEGNVARFWDAATGEPHGLPLGLPPESHISAVAMQPDGKIMLMGAEVNASNILRFWDAATGRPIGLPLTHPGRVTGTAFSTDGKTIVTCSTAGPLGFGATTARLWDAVTGKPLGLPMRHASEVRALAFSPDGGSVLTGGRDGAASSGTQQLASPWDRPCDTRAD